MSSSQKMGCGATICRLRRFLILVLTPLLLIPLPAVLQSKEALAGYIVLLMAVYWITEVMPLGVTALIPLVLTPLFQITTSKELCPTYMKDTNVLFLGGLMVATAIEHWNLHKRIALSVMLVMGTSPRRLMLGFMLPTWFLSMWISNTATTAMMIPIVEAVLQELRQSKQKEKAEAVDGADAIEMDSKVEPLTNEDGGEKAPVEYLDSKSLNLGKAMTLCIAYAASCGGIGTLTGTGPNLILNSQISKEYDYRAKFSFGTWMIFAVPISFVTLMCVWLWLQVWFFGPRQFVSCKSDKESEERAKEVIRRNYKALGPITFAEGSCLFFFGLLVFLWISKEPGAPGWVAWFTENGKRYPTDAQPAILVTLLLFMWPSYNPIWFFKKSRYDIESDGPKRPKEKTLLDWSFVQTNFPWNIVLLLGGGFALAKTCGDSGLSAWIGKQLEVLKDVPVAVLVLVVTLGSACFTEVTSNTATATILLPILNELSKCIKIHPFLLMLPSTVGCSLAFCLPVATPPNAIIFAKGYVKVSDMIKCGIFLNILAILIVTGATLSYGSAFFGMSTFPDWVGQCKNTTAAAVARLNATATS